MRTKRKQIAVNKDKSKRSEKKRENSVALQMKFEWENLCITFELLHERWKWWKFNVCFIICIVNVTASFVYALLLLCLSNKKWTKRKRVNKKKTIIIIKQVLLTYYMRMKKCVVREKCTENQIKPPICTWNSHNKT